MLSLKSFLLGLLGVVVTALFLYFVTLDLRWMVLLLTGYYFGLGYFIFSKSEKPMVAICAGVISPMLFLYLLLGELPDLYFLIPLVVMVNFLGYWVNANGTSKLKQLAVYFLVVALAVGSFKIIPTLVQNQLVKVIDQPAPDFQFTDLGGHVITKEQLQGQVVVLDFFGTWCKPCIKELKELEPIREKYSEVKFYVVSTAQGGDTIEKVRAFSEKRGRGFTFGFDEGGTMHQSFKFTGVPALVIIDKKGNMRMKHEGFNPSEDIASAITSLLDELLEE